MIYNFGETSMSNDTWTLQVDHRNMSGTSPLVATFSWEVASRAARPLTRESGANHSNAPLTIRNIIYCVIESKGKGTAVINRILTLYVNFWETTLIGYPHIGKLKIKVDFYDHNDKFQNNFQKIIPDMFRCTTPSSEDKNWLIVQLNKYEADS